MKQGTPIDYGQDAPGLLRTYLRAGSVLIAAGALLVGGSWRRRWFGPIGAGVVLWGSALLVRGGLMIWSSRRSKIVAANYLLDRLCLRGDETVLDVGCGRGLLLIGAACRLPRGRAIGIDLWSAVDQGHNSKQATLSNAHAAGVAQRIAVYDGDMRDLSLFPDASLDAVVASKSIHNIPNPQGRYRALCEIERVLKPFGKVALMDIFCIQEFAEALRRLGIQEVTVEPAPVFASPALSIITGHKRSAGEGDGALPETESASRLRAKG
jgi:arsenite methyltransferase